ncbi:MAG: alpha/beta fold hydrolase [Candidatus Hydrogenedentota bacterium]
MTFRIPTLVGAIFLIQANAAELTGHWEGELRKGSAKSPISIAATDSGTTWTLPACGWKDYPFNTVRADGNRVELGYGSDPGWTLSGTLNGDSFQGTFVRGDFNADFSLTRVPLDQPYHEEEFDYENGDVHINAALVIPNGPGPHPVVVMLHGSGDHEMVRYRFHADFFARLGVACVIADKRGCGKSTGDWNKVGFVPLAEDGIKAVEKLRARADVDPQRIGMTGISQAGWIMVQAAALSKDVQFLIVDSGAAYDVEREGFYDYEVMLRDKGHSEEEIRKAVEILKADNAITRTGQGFDELKAKREQLKNVAWYRDLGLILQKPDSTGRDFYRKIIDFDPRPLLVKDVNIPVLWLYGEEDKSVSPQECIPILEEIQKKHNKDYTIRVFPRADHGLRVPPDPARDAAPFDVLADGVLDAKTQWLRERILK